MAVLIDLNRYLHDFTSALWVAGSILIWVMMKEASKPDAGQETIGVLTRLIAQVRSMTIPCLVITLCSGGVRAFTFEEHEVVGDITTPIIITLIIKHIAFTAVVSWGIWVHWKSRADSAATREVVQ